MSSCPPSPQACMSSWTASGAHFAKIPTLPHTRLSTPSPYNLTTAHSPGRDLPQPIRLFAHAHVILHMLCMLAFCWAWPGRVACRLVMDAC